MLDVSWGEMMLIGAVALIVIGPKDLPSALRTLGQATTKLRRMASEFRGQFDEAMREAELDKVQEDLRNVGASASGGFNPIQTIRDEIKGAIESRPPETPASAPSYASTEAAATPPVDLPTPPPAAPLDLEEFKAPPKAEKPAAKKVPARQAKADSAAADPASPKPKAAKPKATSTKPAKPKKSATP